MVTTFFVISVSSLTIIFALNLAVGLYYGFGVRHYWFFQLLHILSGFFVAMFFRSFTSSYLLILVGLGVVTLVWESLEYALSHISTWAEFAKKRLRLKLVTYSFSDGIFDVICNYVGAFSLLYLLK